MKIVCDACSAKYSIADEKVKGKVFKIRCKKCSNIIVVRGNTGAAAEEPPAPQFDQKETRVYDYGGYEGGEPPPPGGDEAVWHVVVDQEQVGPLTAAEVQAKFAGGEIDSETYVWREGFADWLPLSQAPEFASLAAGGGTTTDQPSSGAEAVSAMFSSPGYEESAAAERSDPADVFAAHAAKASADADDDGLFGSQQPAAAAAAAAPAPADAAAGSEVKPTSLRGQRSENSVLFSLNNLAALASDSPKAAPVQSSSSSVGAAQHGGGEGSGLIDIRSMASAYLGGTSKPEAAKPGGKIGSIDDLPVFSTATFSEPAVIIPTLGASRSNNKMMYLLLGAVGLLALVAVILVIVVLTGDKGGKSAGASPVAMGGSEKGSAAGSSALPGPGTGSGTAATAAGTGSAAETPPGDGSGTGTAEAAGGSADEDSAGSGSGSASADSGDKKPSSSDRRSSSSDRRSSSSDRRSSSSDRDKKPPTPPPSDSGGKCLDEVACLLAEKPPACCSKYSGSKPSGGGSTARKPPTNSNLPESLTKSDISAGVGKVRSRIEGCGAKSSAKGTVKVSVKVSPSGSVSSVSVKTTPDAALGSCVATNMKRASFAKTQKGGSFAYPFRF